MKHTESELQIIELMKNVCPDFDSYNFLETDRYKGSLFGKFNVYYKIGSNKELGMITGKNNQKKYNLDQFKKNFTTTGGVDGTKVEEGWKGEILIELLKYLQGIKKDQSEEVKCLE
ncbi:hypothetical protein [Enterococcus rotai]|uniref:hypothetical protein n=1 Tax=Enterococcus rotai TaxID=118060 RepID=UPI0032B59706